MDKTPKELLTLQTLAERLKIKPSKARELRRQGVLVPDFFMTHFLLYKASRVPELSRKISL